jgi:hypothetical protein
MTALANIKGITRMILAAGATAAAALTLGATAGSASAACVQVYGSSGGSSSGSAVVCLNGFSYGSTSRASISVPWQIRGSAPHNVYVSYGWVDTGVYNYWSGRLGPNAPSTYAKTISAGGYMDAVQVRLCYDRTLATDVCYSRKILS